MEQPQNKKHPVQQAYESWSQSYDSQANPTRDLSAALCRRFFPAGRARLVVEAGCGTGINTGWLAERAEKLIGFDFSASMLALAEAKVKAAHVSLSQADVLAEWPVPAGQADVVLINLVIEHIADLATLLQRANEILAAGGQIIITEYHPDRVATGKGAQIEDENGVALVEIINHHHPISEYQALARQLGLAITELSTWSPDPKSGAPITDDVEPLILLIIMTKPSRLALAELNKE